MGLFGRNNIDDFDDYKREQAQMRKERDKFDSSNSEGKAKAKNFAKNEKFKVEELPDGSLLYKKENMGKDDLLRIMFILFPIIFVGVMIATGIIYGNISEIVPAAIFFAVFFGIMFAAMGTGKRCKSLKLTYDSIEVEVSSNKKLVFPLSSYEGLFTKRIYGKNHHYSGTVYHILIRDGMEVKKFKFCSSIPAAASDFDYNAKKRKHELNGPEADYIVETGRKTFSWSEKLTKGNWTTNRLALMIPAVALIIIGIACAMIFGGDPEEVIFPMVVLMVMIIVTVLIYVFGSNSFIPTIYPESMTFGEGELRINDLSISSNEIKAVYITPIGSDNPHAPHCSTFYIAVENGQYRYKAVPMLSRNDLSWSYEEFYYCCYNWCKINNVPFIEYIL
ncbi:MAG: hypothetical protein MJ108_04630 [Saccharofermentans sp.]|nr:hypothetical protein [Saccharofermentans sp.]